ncbi:hypothetical protein Belba_0248 [Belliella baltica DSM 15883]|uniref:Uncharacterized protein n=1 Tax=Belliella baltica (strain DSM 15883 / CIP 108006 / LMG 21964 / BA134) TaxID=866536 RepID=I3Z0Z7_BELBD|nr:hypothetical protein [Belliella baltica]AFL82915.1 hypothetical protein Belba_0248 [Belliella baltica DSM 15883]
MKTSNKLLFSFLGFAWLSIMVSLMVSFKYSNPTGVVITNQTFVDESPISGDFSVVSIQDSWVVSLENDGEKRVEYTRIKTDKKGAKEHGDPDPYFLEVREDTLFIQGMQQKPNGGYSLYIGDSIKSLVLENVKEVNVRKDISLDSLIVQASNSTFKLQKGHGLSALSYSGISDSRLSVEGISFLSIYLQNSNAIIEGDLGKISGELIGAELSLPLKTGGMNLKKDDYSKIRVASR